LVASDGGIFAFGDARFYGSTGSLHLNRPIVTLIDGRQGAGYSLVASDGGVFSFGSAPFFGSLGGMPVSTPIVGAAETPRDDGYWFTNAVGLVSNFGRAGYYGSAPYPLAAPVVGMAEAPGTGSFTLDPLPHTANGYDVSEAQCGGLPSGAHAFGVVQVDGASSGAMNPCLAAEVAWAGAGLNLYTFLTYTSSAVNEPGCNGDIACNAGYQAGIHAYADAVANGVDVKVPWWLDVEVTGNWSANPSENAQLVQGAINALHEAEGVADVGIYASTGEWNSIVGGYQADVPYWMANWTGSGPSSCASFSGLARSHALPTGPLEITQYASNTYDYDYTCS
jgi:hypothetical protein